jgi:hypothetical protein
MKRYMIVALTAFLFTACKKDKIELAIAPITEETEIHQEAAYVFPTTIGSYWIYGWYETDNLGNKTLLPTVDTISIIGDTLLNNSLYTIYNESFLGNDLIKYKRDSSGYIIDNFGKIEYSYVDFTTTIPNFSADPTYTSFSKMKNIPSIPISVPAGVFKTIERQKHIRRTDGSPISTCAGSQVIFPTNYVTGIGKIRTVLAYSNSIQDCEHMVQYLIEFHIP